MEVQTHSNFPCLRYAAAVIDMRNFSRPLQLNGERHAQQSSLCSRFPSSQARSPKVGSVKARTYSGADQPLPPQHKRPRRNDRHQQVETLDGDQGGEYTSDLSLWSNPVCAGRSRTLDRRERPIENRPGVKHRGGSRTKVFQAATEI